MSLILDHALSTFMFGFSRARRVVATVCLPPTVVRPTIPSFEVPPAIGHCGQHHKDAKTSAQENKPTNHDTHTHNETKIVGNSRCFFTLLVTSFPSVPLCVSHFPQVHDVSRTHVFDFMRTALSDVTHPCIWHGSKAQETCHFTSTCRSYA